MKLSTSVKIFNQSKRKLFLWATMPVLIALLVVVRSAWEDGSFWAEVLKLAGIFLIFMCIIGRCWAILYIGDKKNRKVVDQGPYRYTRNPLYFFSALGMAGFGLLLESFFLGVILYCYTYLSFLYVARKEAADLTRFFGEDYLSYRKMVPEFLPNPFSKVPNKTQDDQVTFSPKALRKTFQDACLFLLTLPLAELIVAGHNSGGLPNLFHMY